MASTLMAIGVGASNSPLLRKWHSGKMTNSKSCRRRNWLTYSWLQNAFRFLVYPLRKWSHVPIPQISEVSTRGDFDVSSGSEVHNRVLKSPRCDGNVTLPIRGLRVGTIFAGTLFFRFTFFWVAKESEQGNGHNYFMALNPEG